MAHISLGNYEYLESLKKNNNKSFFDKHKDRYLQYHEEMIAFADALLFEVKKFDEIDTPSGKKSLMRIYRDVRFSKDKTPYKTHWGGGFHRAGAERRGGYYYHIEKNNSFIGGGFWAPNTKDLLHIRQQINYHAKPLRDVLNDKKFKSYFGQLQGETLKSAPKGFDKENENIDLINHKEFIISHKFSHGETMEKDFHKKMATGFKNMLPLFNVLTEYLTTDLNGESLL